MISIKGVRSTLCVALAGSWMITGLNAGFAGSDMVTVDDCPKEVIFKDMGRSPCPLLTSGAANQNSVLDWPGSAMAKR